MEFKREPLTKDERWRLEAACESGRDKLVVWVMLDVGLRLDEFVRLDYGSVDWQDRKLVVIGKGKKRRVLPLTERVVSLLSHHFGNMDGGQGIGISRRTVGRVVKRVANRAGLTKKISPHVLRHTFACHALQDGVSVVTLMKLLGHASLQTTMIYLNLSGEEAVREFREKVEGKKGG